VLQPDRPRGAARDKSVLVPTLPPSQWAPGFFPMDKATLHKADHFPQSRAEVNSAEMPPLPHMPSECAKGLHSFTSLYFTSPYFTVP
jgi:hypothetical protein